MKKTAWVISAIAYIAILAVIVGAIVMVFAFVNNGQKNFYVQYGNEKISNKAENIVLPKNATSLFYCKNVLGVTDSTEKATGFTVSIQANTDAFSDYDFSGLVVGGKNVDFYRSIDFTKGFDLHVCDGYFALYLPEELTMQTVLEKVYADTVVSGVPQIDLYEKDYFSMVVYSEADKSTVTIGFH